MTSPAPTDRDFGPRYPGGSAHIRRGRAIDWTFTMNTLIVTPLISLIAGILIFIMPKLLNYIVAVYLIVIGLVGLLNMGSVHLR